MNIFEELKAHLPVTRIFHMSLLSILSFLVFSGPGYGSTDIPVTVNTAPAAIGSAALFAGIGNESGLTNQGIYTALNGDVASTAPTTFVTGLYDESAVYTEMLLDIETVNGTMHTAHPSCQDQDSCSL